MRAIVLLVTAVAGCTLNPLTPVDDDASAEGEGEEDEAGCGSDERTITAEYYSYVNLETGEVLRADFDLPPSEPWDILFAYNAETEPDPAFIQVNFSLDVGWNRDSSTFDELCNSSDSFTTSPNYGDVPLSESTTFVIRTHGGRVVKIGDPEQLQQNGTLQVRFRSARL